MNATAPSPISAKTAPNPGDCVVVGTIVVGIGVGGDVGGTVGIAVTIT